MNVTQSSLSRLVPESAWFIDCKAPIAPLESRGDAPSCRDMIAINYQGPFLSSCELTLHFHSLVLWIPPSDGVGIFSQGYLDDECTFIVGLAHKPCQSGHGPKFISGSMHIYLPDLCRSLRTVLLLNQKPILLTDLKVLSAFALSMDLLYCRWS